MKLRPALLHWLALILLSAGLGRALAAAPVVSHVRAAQRTGTPLADVYYDLADADRPTTALRTTAIIHVEADCDFPASSSTDTLGITPSPVV